MESTLSSTTLTTTTTIPVVGYDFLTPLLTFLFGDSGLFSAFSLTGVGELLQTFWMIVVVVGYLVVFFFLYFYVYAAIGIGKLEAIKLDRIVAHEKAFTMKSESAIQSDRFTQVRRHIESDNPNDWRHAIIEADIMLDRALEQLGYAGTSLGERLRSITPAMLTSIDDAWEAHKVRNHIAHSGPDFVLTEKKAREAIMRYERVLTELNVL